MHFPISKTCAINTTKQKHTRPITSRDSVYGRMPTSRLTREQSTILQLWENQHRMILHTHCDWQRSLPTKLSYCFHVRKVNSKECRLYWNFSKQLLNVDTTAQGGTAVGYTRDVWIGVVGMSRVHPVEGVPSRVGRKGWMVLGMHITQHLGHLISGVRYGVCVLYVQLLVRSK